jgi:ribonucleoside-diphosphate reductase alpha chain
MQISANFVEVDISEVEVGNIVLSNDGADHVFNLVDSTFINTVLPHDQVCIGLETGYEFVCSSSHSMWTKNGWQKASDIVPGDLFLADDLVYVKVRSVERVDGIAEDFYDLMVDNDHSYFIGDEGRYYLSHNSATVTVPWWHYEIQDVIVLKNNRGTDDNRVKKLDYSIQLDNTFYDRVKNDETITLFCPQESDLYQYWGTPEFTSRYEEAEGKSLRLVKTIKARDLLFSIAKERLETGRIYIMNMDQSNRSAWSETVLMGNLCQEVLMPTVPLVSSEDENGRIGICILSAVNLLEVKASELPSVCSTIVKLLNSLIDYQLYPFNAAELFCKRKRSLGVGVTNFAAWLAEKGLNHESKEAIIEADRMMEAVQYYLLSASCDEAEQFGRAEDFSASRYSTGWLPIDFHSSLPAEIQCETTMDWESLRKRISEYGLRNCTMTSQMPVESSSVTQCSTNGIEPIRAFLTEKIAKNGTKKVLVPNYPRHKKNYVIAWDMPSNLNSIKIAGALQKWIDMAISFNTYLNYNHYENGEIPISVVVQDIINAYKYGLRTMYYNNTPNDNEEADTSCAGGACTL